jgi:competence protein ComEA
MPRVSLSTATAEQLDAVAEGIGPTLAARIVEYRDQNGGFQSVEQLREVPGIGEVRLQALRDAVLP